MTVHVKLWSLQPDSTHFFSCSNVCLSVRHYYSEKYYMYHEHQSSLCIWIHSSHAMVQVFHMQEFFLYFWRGQTLFICVNTGPLALTKTIPALPWTLFWLYKCAHISQWKTDQCSRRWTLFWPVLKIQYIAVKIYYHCKHCVMTLISFKLYYCEMLLLVTHANNLYPITPLWTPVTS